MNSSNEIVPGIPAEPEEKSKFGTPNIPISIYSDLPEILQKACSLGSNNSERDILLLSSLGTLSGCLPAISGIYDRHKVYSNLYSYIIAPPASGKGLIDLPKNLALPINKMLLQKSMLKKNGFDDDEDEEESEDGNNDENEKETEEKGSVPEMLIIPADCTATAFNELMINNNYGSIMIETEGTILSERFRSSHGQFRSSFLKAAHHETISYYRRTEKEWKYIESPRLSIVISSTPPQVKQLIPTIDDGLASRFLFYYFDSEPAMKNVFSKSKFDSDKFIQGLGDEVLSFYNLQIGSKYDVNISLTKQQQKNFLSTFSAWHDKFHILSGEDSLAVVRRLGLATFRICMILTALRNLNLNTISRNLTCNDVDFNIASEIISTLKEHSLMVFERLIPRKQHLSVSGTLYGVNRAVFDKLPAEIDRKTAITFTNGSISVRSLDRMLNSPLFEKTRYGRYRKIEHV